MNHEDELGEPAAFATVAEERSFTGRARRGVSQPALSHTMRGLEKTGAAMTRSH